MDVRFRFASVFVALTIAALIAGAPPAPAATGAAHAKLDAALLAALETPSSGSLDILVNGLAHRGLDEQMFPSRASAMAYLESKAAPFFGSLRALAESLGGRLVDSWAASPAARLVVPRDGVRAIAARPDVGAIALNAPDAVSVVPIPDDSPGASNTEGRRMLEAEEIWALGFRGEGIKIAVIDTGIDATHEAFRNADGSSRLAAFKDVVNDRTSPYDDNGHGTHVSATAMGSADFVDPAYGAFQETGVAPKATLMSAKFLNAAGSGSFADSMEALQWAFDNGADITSNSWGSTSCTATEAVIQLIHGLTDLGMLSVFAAGNSGASGARTIGGPACGEAPISVGAVDKDGNIASFSSRGPCTDPYLDTPERICPDVVAKGVSVRSAIPRSGATYADPSGYKVWQGTSMATPHIAGAVALAEQMKRFYTGTGWDTAARAEEEIFKLTTLDLGAPGPDSTFGWGLPKLTFIEAILTAPAIPDIRTTFSITPNTIRSGDTTQLAFGVRNFGNGSATGDFLATLTDTQGAVTELKRSTVTLGLLDGESASSGFLVSGNVGHGEYTFKGTFDYSYVDPDNGETVTESILREGTFTVAKASVDMSLEGFAAQTLPGAPQQVTLKADSVGNEDAANVVIEVTVPDRYVFVPGANFDPQDMRTRYSNPAPTSVREDSTFHRVTLLFDVGALPVGQSFSFTTNLAPTTPGEYRVLGVAKFKDGAGRSIVGSDVFVQQAGLPQ